MVNMTAEECGRCLPVPVEKWKGLFGVNTLTCGRSIGRAITSPSYHPCCRCRFTPVLVDFDSSFVDNLRDVESFVRPASHPTQVASFIKERADAHLFQVLHE